MADSNPNIAIRVLVTNTAVWTPITCPITCGQISIQNPDATNAQKFRTDSADLLTEKPLPISSEVTFRASGPSAWGPGMVIGFVQSAGASTVVVTFLR